MWWRVVVVVVEELRAPVWSAHSRVLVQRAAAGPGAGDLPVSPVASRAPGRAAMRKGMARGMARGMQSRRRRFRPRPTRWRCRGEVASVAAGTRAVTGLQLGARPRRPAEA